MPIHEYKCAKCGKVFEKLQKFSDPALTVHEECGGQVEQLVSAPAFHLKGSGWYATDYAKGSGASGKPDVKTNEHSESKSDSGSSSDSASDSKATDSKTTSETKTESKPESKPAATPKQD